MRDSKQGGVVLSGSGWDTGVSSMNFGVQGGIVCPSHSQGVHYSLLSVKSFAWSSWLLLFDAVRPKNGE